MGQLLITLSLPQFYHLHVFCEIFKRMNNLDMFTTYMWVVHVRVSLKKKNMTLFEYALILMYMYLYYHKRTNVREVLHLNIRFYCHLCE